MPTPSPYRSLPQERRIALVTHALRSNRERRTLFIQRMLSRGGGFRAATLQKWPPDRLAREIVRTRAETAEDELDLLQMLYIELEPEIQVTFLDAAGVAHEGGRIAEELEPPFAGEEAVARGVEAVRAEHGERGEHYLRTLARYGPEAWPGIASLVQGD